jgi:Tol biopolymer transport system component
MNAGGIRDIKTIAADGGEPVAVTSDPDVDWNPLWSSDGRYLYFASNRGGSMNFWRIAIEEKTGMVTGQPSPFTTPSVFSQNLSFSSDGKVFAYAQQVNTENIVEAVFDQQREIVDSQTKIIGKSSRLDRNPSISPDGQWIAFDGVKEKQEDIYIMRRDGSGVVQLTNDPFKDRAPRWSPDGKHLAFFSDRSGRHEAWMIDSNGTNLTQLSNDSEPFALLTFWSPDGTKIVKNVAQSYGKIYDAALPFKDQTPFQIPAEDIADVWEMAYSWSPDGKKIAQLRLSQHNYSGIAVYDLQTNRQEEVSNFGDAPVWLNDNRRLIFSQANKLYLLDTLTKQSKELLALAPGDVIPGITVTPDNRYIYFSLQQKESNLWLGAAE